MNDDRVKDLMALLITPKALGARPVARELARQIRNITGDSEGLIPEPYMAVRDALRTKGATVLVKVCCAKCAGGPKASILATTQGSLLVAGTSPKEGLENGLDQKGFRRTAFGASDHVPLDQIASRLLLDWPASERDGLDLEPSIHCAAHGRLDVSEDELRAAVKRTKGMTKPLTLSVPPVS